MDKYLLWNMCEFELSYRFLTRFYEGQWDKSDLPITIRCPIHPFATPNHKPSNALELKYPRPHLHISIFSQTTDQKGFKVLKVSFKDFLKCPKIQTEEKCGVTSNVPIDGICTRSCSFNPKFTKSLKIF